MKLAVEIKKIVLDANLKPTATVVFSLDTHKDLETFKKGLTAYVNEAMGQTTL